MVTAAPGRHQSVILAWVRLQRPALAQARGRVLRLRYPGQRRRGSPQAAAVDAQAWRGCWPAAWTGPSCPISNKARSDGPVSARVLAWAGEPGLEASRERQSRRPIPSLDKGKERATSRLRLRAGPVLSGGITGRHPKTPLGGDFCLQPFCGSRITGLAIDLAGVAAPLRSPPGTGRRGFGSLSTP
jgi:hypothetical protein